MIQSIVNRVLLATIPSLTDAKGKQRLSILIYHRVLRSPDYMRQVDPTAEQFSWQMELLSRYFCPLSLSEAFDLMVIGKLPERAVCVTFDDGYADNEQLALPVLKKWRVPATVFVSSKFVDGGMMWNDTVVETLRNPRQRQVDLSSLGMGRYSLTSETSRKLCAFNIIKSIKYLSAEERLRAVELIQQQAVGPSPELMLTSRQLKSLFSSGVEIGGHTYSHPILSSLSDIEAREEIMTGKRILEEILGVPIRFFAYPNGIPGQDYLPVHPVMVKEAGFDAALTTQWGFSDQFSDRWQLNRFTPWDKVPAKFLGRLLWNLGKSNN